MAKKKILTKELLKLESIQQTCRNMASTSKKYIVIPTMEIVNMLANEGWIPNKTSEIHAKSRRGFQKHHIRFRREKDAHRKLAKGELIPEIGATNAHDGTASFNFSGGLHRCVCKNQMTVSDGTIQSYSAKHRGFKAKDVLKKVLDLAKQLPKVLKRVHHFQQIEIDRGTRRQFASKALDLAFEGDKWVEYNKKDTIGEILVPTRNEDQMPTLWTTFNIIQEKLLNGGRFLVPKKIKYFTPVLKIKEVKSIDHDINLNKALWELTEKFSE